MALMMDIAVSGTAVAQPAEEAPVDTPVAEDAPPGDGETPNIIITLLMEGEVNPPADRVENAPSGNGEVDPPADVPYEE